MSRLPPGTRDYLAAIGSKGGKASGKRKARSPEHYRKMAEKSAKAQRKKATSDSGMDYLLERLRYEECDDECERPCPLQRKLNGAAADEIERLRREWERECSDGDAVLHAAGLTPDDYRTDGGSINVPKVHSKLMAQEISHRAKIVTLERELAEAREVIALLLAFEGCEAFDDVVRVRAENVLTPSDQPGGIKE